MPAPRDFISGTCLPLLDSPQGGIEAVSAPVGWAVRKLQAQPVGRVDLR